MLFVACALLSSAYYAFSSYEDFSQSAGHEWNSYDDSSRSGFTLGFIVGIHKALEELELTLRQSSSSKEEIEGLLPIYNTTNTQLKEHLDIFYRDPANANIPIKDAAIIVCKELQAEDKERIEKKKRLLRLPPEEQRIVKRADYLKEKIKRGEYSKYKVQDGGVIEKESGEVVPLETEEEIVDFWTKQVFPEEAPQVKEIVKPDYKLAGIIAVVALGAIALILFNTKKKKCM